MKRFFKGAMLALATVSIMASCVSKPETKTENVEEVADKMVVADWANRGMGEEAQPEPGCRAEAFARLYPVPAQDLAGRLYHACAACHVFARTRDRHERPATARQGHDDAWAHP